MAEAIDIYIKLLIAILSFIAPLIVFMLSISNDGMAEVRQRAIEEQKVWDEIRAREGLIQSVKELVSTAQASAAKSLKIKINLLNPKRQIIRIFLLLAGAIFAIVGEKVNKLFAANGHCDWLTRILAVLSILCFIYGIWVLQQVTWAVINTKQELAQKAYAISKVQQPIINPSDSPVSGTGTSTPPHKS